MTSTPDYEVVVIGAGFGGINAGVQLRKAGIENFVILDKWDKVGGTWNANHYPGVAVDIPSFLYQFSYHQKGDWSRLFAPGREIQAYAEDVVDTFGLRPKLRLNTTVTGARFDEATDTWHVRTDAGEVTGRFLVAGVGGLEVPNLPGIPGIESFGGTVLHTADWDHSVDLRGTRVGVIGTGASALQLIPEAAEVAADLTVFQRTPIWVAPKPDWRAGPLTKRVLGNPLLRAPLRGVGMVGVEIGVGAGMVHGRAMMPLIRGAEAALKLWMRTQVDDPETRRKLTPRYLLGCKRPSLHNTYFKTYNLPHVHLVTDPIEKVTPEAVHTRDGAAHELDILVCATGFKVMAKGATPPFPALGRDGLDLNEYWERHRYQAYQGVSVPKFPNAFLVIGPYAYAPGSYLVLIEATGKHMIRVITEARRRGATRVEIRQEPHDRYFQDMQRRVTRGPLLTPACHGSNTYYLNHQGDAAAFRPSSGAEMRWTNSHFPLSDYRFTRSTALLEGESA
ncbi:NAD(P)/FAD-dependent oxidoreductase [Nocardia puris]|uniref:flavin-containing monooxygenase n=1 Tax=Nocardia puris TaxID=208602 RepID=UPI001893B164|nr:NAD(P)/FAD-dependent oxidoreductase [Nocardia puris]MBF6209718.1 NAD(P)/FAD-dependent oxidoreductase [Nocardia puris]MBF6366290.1 NAD(P)/FAD-dependent oxidoreductase [Nocardia puris]MBF6458371.1 NAD(P)/FAD-dependent oxidoreductase [Nocardia puris]